MESLKILKDEKISFTCNFVGGEGDITKKDFNDKLKDFNLFDEVFYLGKMFGDEKKNIFLNSDIFVLPTFYHNECLPLVILEAMQFGLPIISTYEGAIPDVIDNNINGILINSKDPKALHQKIKFLIQNETIRADMGFSARRKFSQLYSINNFEKKINTIFDEE